MAATLWPGSMTDRTLVYDANTWSRENELYPQLRAIVNAPANIRHVAILGGPDTGKSSLLSQLERVPFYPQRTCQQRDSPHTTKPNNLYMRLPLPLATSAAAATTTTTTTTTTATTTTATTTTATTTTTASNTILNVVLPERDIKAALCIVDGAILMMNVVEGATKCTELLLHLILEADVKVVLFLNKFDRFWSEIGYEHAYRCCYECVEFINNIVPNVVSPNEVIFGSARRGWGFTLETFARMYAVKFGLCTDKLVEYLWSDNYYDVRTKKWLSKSNIQVAEKQMNGFSLLIAKPIHTLYCALVEEKVDIYTPMLKRLSITLSEQEQEGNLPNIVFARWLPLAVAVTNVVSRIVPSPFEAQRARAMEFFSSSPSSDVALRKALQECRPDGPLIMRIGRSIVTRRGMRYFAGRVLSGTVSLTQTLANVTNGSCVRVASLAHFVAPRDIPLPSCMCGNVVMVQLSHDIDVRGVLADDVAFSGLGYNRYRRVLEDVSLRLDPLVRMLITEYCAAYWDISGT